MDILRKITDEELDFIISRLQSELPYALKDLLFIQSAKRCKEFTQAHLVTDISDKLLPEFYTHREGKKENCTILGITGHRDHTVWYFTFQESLEEIRECLEKTKLIDWKERLLFVTIHREQTKPIFECIEKFSYKLQGNEEISYYFLPIEEALEIKLEAPQGTFYRRLKEDESELCNSLWKYRSRDSELWLRGLIQIHGGFGLFDESSNELISFAVINDHMATGVLNTVEQARGKGYGKFVAQLHSLKIAEDFNVSPTVYINSSNSEASKNLYLKLGYKRIGDCNWISVGNVKYSEL